MQHLPSERKILSNAEILSALKGLLGVSSENNGEIAKKLELSRQQIYQFAKSESITIHNRIITALIERLETEIEEKKKHEFRSDDT